jgi:hypothetical protein
MDIGGAKHWQKELGKLAPQTIVVNGNHYERTEFGGPWKFFLPENRVKQEREAKEAHEKRMFELNTAKEWYSMTEDQRKDVGSKLFPTVATPEGGWTREKLVEAGIFSKAALSRPESAASFWSAQGQLGSIKQKGMDAENQPIFAFQGKTVSVPTEIGKFSQLAGDEGYFQENKELNEFLTQIGREAKSELTKMTPKAVEAAKAEALQKRIEDSQNMPSSSGRASFKRGLSSSSKNTLRVGGFDATQEQNQPVNIPT